MYVLCAYPPVLSPQGGHFDLPDRLFHSVEDGWLSAAETNMADVKELIPEFFYLPEFLTNHNNFDFGEHFPSYSVLRSVSYKAVPFARFSKFVLPSLSI